MKKLFVFSLLIPLALQAYNAGVLPYAKKGGKTYFLLGKEAKGHYKNQWADFGGKGKPGESVKETAIREFTEETRAAFAQLINPALTDKKRYKEALWESDNYIESRLSDGITNPGPKKFYTLYLAHVDYLAPNLIKNGAYIHGEKSDFEWVDAQNFLATLLRNNRYAEDYMNGDKRNYYPSFGNKQIRRPFATYFADHETSEHIRSIMGLPAFRFISESKLKREWAAQFIGVYEDAPINEIEEKIKHLRRQKVMRERGFWTDVALAYEILTGKKFNLFGIDETPTHSLTYDFENVSSKDKALIKTHNHLQELRKKLKALIKFLE